MEENIIIQKDVWFDMETGDPDDCVTLLFLLQNTNVRLRGVSIYPGDDEQVGFIRGLLKKYSPTEIPIGCFSFQQNEKNHLGPNNIRLFGNDVIWKPGKADDEAHNLLAKFLLDHPSGYIITGGPLGNIYNLLVKHPETVIQHIFVQGGFAGANCVPPENQLPKFQGLFTCPTFNFSAHIKGANALLESNRIQKRFLISKDVCHGVAWDNKFHKLAVNYKKNSSPIWNLLIDAMGSYLHKKPEGKLLHDPLAACTSLNNSIITFCEVKVSRDQRGHWGSKPQAGTNTWISIGVDKLQFYSVLLDIPKDKLEGDL
jgi:pyrimidine-specific ribonucleoside hydrolase